MGCYLEPYIYQLLERIGILEDAEKEMNGKKNRFKGLEGNDVEEDPVQTVLIFQF